MTNKRLNNFISKIQFTQTCWIWTGYIGVKGYGAFGYKASRPMPAHRWSYEYFVGPIPKGLTIDHLCRVRNCVNPDHLEAVSNRTNTLRGEGITAKAARTAHCPNGHPYTSDNTYVYPHFRHRKCCICFRLKPTPERFQRYLEGR